MSGTNAIIVEVVVKNTRVTIAGDSIVMTVGRVGRGYRKRFYSPDEADQLALDLFAKAAQVRHRTAADRAVASLMR